MSLVDASASRKARLEALRKRKAGDVVGEDGKPAPIQLKQRNFDPSTREAKKFTMDSLDSTIEGELEGVTDKILAEDEARRTEELNLLNIAPKRPNWDLKRDLDRISAKLERETNEAIKSVIRARIVSQNGSSSSKEGGLDLVGALDALGGDDDDDDDDEENEETKEVAE